MLLVACGVITGGCIALLQFSCLPPNVLTWILSEQPQKQAGLLSSQAVSPGLRQLLGSKNPWLWLVTELTVPVPVLSLPLCGCLQGSVTMEAE